MSDPESETLKARIHDAVAAGGAGIVIFAVIIAAQMIIAPLGLAMDHMHGIHHAHHDDSLATEQSKR
jgi:hypothetical protein